VTPEQLREVAAKYGPAAYVLTTGDDSRTRVTHSAVSVASGVVDCVLGGRAAANALARPGISVLWAATDAEPMSLIADGVAEPDEAGEDGSFSIRIESAMLHRAAPA